MALSKPAGTHASITPSPSLPSGYEGNPVVIALIAQGGDYLEKFSPENLNNKLLWHCQQLQMALMAGEETLAKNNQEAIGLLGMALNGW